MPETDTPHQPGRPRALARLVLASVLLPLAILLLGLWEMQRGPDDWAELAAEHQRLSRVVADLEARTPKDGRPDYRLEFRQNGRLYGGPYAVEKAREARDEVALNVSLLAWRQMLPPVVVAGGGIATALSLFVLLAGALLGLLGRGSRDALVRGFSLVRLLLPAILAIQILAATTGFVAAAGFEAVVLVLDGFSGDSAKLFAIALAAIGVAVVAAGGALLGLRRALGAFEPDPLPILGRQIIPAEAPGLWRLVEQLAQRMGALKPEVVVVGLTDGFFVTAGPAVLEPSGARLSGRILYLPLPYLALMRPDETAAIIAHELAHYAGGDTVYSQRFLPIYVGVGRSLDAVAERHHNSFGLLGPSLRLGLFVMERFHLAVRQWSRVREFAADAAGAQATSARASARALLRYGASGPRIVETLEVAVEAPDAAPSDLVAAVLDHASAHGLDDPSVHLEAEQAHPTDTHPPTRQRIEALRQAIEAGLMADAGAPPAPDAREQLASYFTNPEGLCRAATQDFLDVVHARRAAARSHLEATAEAGAETMELRANFRTRGWALAVGGGVFAVAALAIGVLGIPGASPREMTVALVTVTSLAVLFGAVGSFMLLRQEPVGLILKADGLTAPGLDGTIGWGDIADLDLLVTNGQMVMRLLLPPQAPWPQRAPGRRRGVKLDAKRRIVTLSFGLPHKMKPQDFAALLGRYQTAHEARKILAERHLASTVSSENHAA